MKVHLPNKWNPKFVLLSFQNCGLPTTIYITTIYVTTKYITTYNIYNYNIYNYNNYGTWLID